MAIVKWLTRSRLDAALSTATSKSPGLSFRSEPDGPRTPITHLAGEVAAGTARYLRNWYTRRRLGGGRGTRDTRRRALSGGGVPVAKVSLASTHWRPAELDPPFATLPGVAGVAYGTRRPGVTMAFPPCHRPPMATRSLSYALGRVGFGNTSWHRVRVRVR